jgi:hypothetical protein
MLSYELEHTAIELELGWELVQKLVHTVKELNEDRASLVVPVPSVEVPEAPLELVPERKPVLFDQHLETLNGPEVGIKHKLR